MIIPAAGLGSRLKSSTPKVLFPVAGRPMIDHLLRLYAPFIARFVLVLHPSFAGQVERHLESSELEIDYDIQTAPTGMLDAVLLPKERVRLYQPEQIWITWCDQIAVNERTARTLAETADREKRAALVMPSIVKPEPYIHLVRDEQGTIIDLLHRREGDRLPDPGESDIGLFCVTRHAYLELLPRFAAEAVRGQATHERNFLPFIPWVAGKEGVATFPALDAIESIGINDATDLRRIEEHFHNERQETLRHYSRVQ
jgi:bifunctional UDP-N-acetylglucosamine pyrophosphorylase/glucosamine-1-phosphate N-acetyltransferase